MKKIYLLIFLCFISQNILAAENLVSQDYIGAWQSDWTAVEGETQSLIFLLDGTVNFKRTFPKHNQQSLHAQDTQNLDGLILLDFLDKSGELVCKMVLSGWKTDSTMKLYGTMFLYRDGVQFNGIPLSFTKRNN